MLHFLDICPQHFSHACCHGYSGVTCAPHAVGHVLLTLSDQMWHVSQQCFLIVVYVVYCCAPPVSVAVVLGCVVVVPEACVVLVATVDSLKVMPSFSSEVFNSSVAVVVIDVVD